MIDDLVTPNHAAPTVFQLQVGGRHFPAVVFTADQVKRRDPGVFEEDRLLDPRRRTTLATGR